MSDANLAPIDRDELEGLYGLTDELVNAVKQALQEDRAEAAQALLEPLHAADVADLFEHLSTGERDTLIEALGDWLDPAFYSYLDESLREDVLEELDNARLAEVVAELDSDDAIDLIEDLEEADQLEVLSQIAPKDRILYQQSLNFPEESAGRLMRREAASVPSYWTVGQTIDYMRSDAGLPSDFYSIVVLGPSYKPLGQIALSRLLRTKRPAKVTDIMDEEMKTIPATMNQENVAFLFRQYGLVSAPVIDDFGRLVGVITVDDVVDVIHEENEHDMLNLGGVNEDDLFDAVLDTTCSRLPWLIANLGTAIIASLVIGLFDDALEQIVALAILMPIVASMGGNAGTQTLTVAVRAMAMKELTASNAMRIVGKEVLVGGINGILFALLMGVVAWLWFGNETIGIVMAAAMVLNLLCAGFAGTMIPLLLDRLHVDPAVGSTVILTTVTDVVGFLSFLGLAALVLL